jgi:hypothetical protein
MSISLAGSEFSGGVVTGRLLGLHFAAVVLFLASSGFGFRDRRLATAFACFGCLLALPLYLYFVAPGPICAVFQGTYGVPLLRAFEWDVWAFGAIVIVVGATTASVVASKR